MLFAAVAILAVLALAAPFIHKAAGRATGAILAAVPFAFFLFFAAQIGRVAEGNAILERVDWIPQIGLSLSLYLDGLGLLFCLLVTGVGGFVLLYAGGDLKGHPQLGRFYAYLTGFMVSMLGLVLADNILVFIFWELTSITSYLLIGFDHHREEARKSALQALLTTGLGGLIMLAGLVMIAEIGGSYELSQLSALAVSGAVDFSAHPLYVPAVITLLAGCFTKSAQFPFHFWLPNAMEAPSPVSAYLHSSTMVKAGVYLIARTNPVLSGTELWFWLLAGFGAATMLVGAYLATRQTYLKKLLAYSTVSSLGIMVMLLGLGEGGLFAHGEASGAHAAATNGAKAAAAYIFAHALFKGTLFLVAGNVGNRAHIKDAEKLGKLFALMPITAACAVVGALSMAGVPPFNGFAGKELLLKASLHADAATWFFVIASVLAGAWTVFISFMIAWRVFFAPRADNAPEYHDVSEAPIAMWAGPVFLSIAALVAGVMPGLFAQPLIAATTASITGHEHAVAETKLSLAYLAKPSPALLCSVIALVLGALVYRFRAGWKLAIQPLGPLDRVGPLAGYAAALKGLNSTASWQTRLLQNGYLSIYIKTIVVAFVVLGWWALFRATDAVSEAFSAEFVQGVTVVDAALFLMITGGSVAVLFMRTRLAAIASMGVVGYAIAMVFVVYGAPDVAMTQFSIETLTVIIFVLVLYSLPRFAIHSGSRQRIIDAVVSLAFGALMTTLVLVANTEQVITAAGTPLAPISGYFADVSYTLAQGKNVVNVILVDFRGVDTMGEIFVLGLAAVGVYTLLVLRHKNRAAPEPGLGDIPDDASAPGKLDKALIDAAAHAESASKPQASDQPDQTQSPGDTPPAPHAEHAR